MKKNCNPGEILRKGYTRKAYTRKDGVKISETKVKPVCIKDKGKPGKGPNLFKILEKNTLRGFGYSSFKNVLERHESLKKAVKNIGKNTVIKKLNAVAILNKNTNPKIAGKFKADMQWVQNNFD